MELSVRQRAAAFAAVVAALAVLGWYLFLTPAGGAAGSQQGRHPDARYTGQAAPPGTASPAAHASTAPPSASVTPSPGLPKAAARRARPDIYQWLPFTRAGLARAAQDAIRFGSAYGSYSYSENTAGYLAPMRGLITPALAALLGRAYAAPGVAGDRVRHKQVSTGVAAIRSLRGFGPASLIFVLAISQRITGDRGTSRVTRTYAVTLTGSGTGWRVSDIELAAAGNS